MPFLTFASVSTYPEMLRKIGWYTFFAILICMYTLRIYVPPIGELSTYIDTNFPIEISILSKLPSSYAGIFILSVVLALFAHAIKLHDKLSWVLKIRSEFDVNYILYPMVILSGSKLTMAQFGKLRSERNLLMGKVFYQYASSTNPKIDTHNITEALTNWSWYWLLLEMCTVFFATSICLIIYGAWGASTFFLFFCVAMFLLMRFFRLQSVDLAERQIQLILDDNTRKVEISELFHAL